jgi:hypothetical protein
MDLTGKKIWFLLGAGISVEPPASVPLWNDMKSQTLDDIARTMVFKLNKSGGNTDLIAEGARPLASAQLYPEMVMESLCHAYGRKCVVENLSSIVRNERRLQPNSCHTSIAELCKMGKVSGILTTNFDTLIEIALRDRGVNYQVCVDSLPINGSGIPIFKLHGSIEMPGTLAFLRQDYFCGLPPQLRSFLRQNLRNSVFIIAGYSGNDIDVFPLIKAILQDRTARNDVYVIDVKDLSQNSRFADIRNTLNYIKRPAGIYLKQMLEEEAVETDMKRNIVRCSLLRDSNKFEGAIFLADCLLLRGDVVDARSAYRLFFLAQDVVEEELGDFVALSKALLGKALSLYAMHQNEEAETEYSAGRLGIDALLSRSQSAISKRLVEQYGYSLRQLEHLETPRRAGASGFMGGRRMPVLRDSFRNSTEDTEALADLLAWEFRARVQTCLAALSAAQNANTDSTTQQKLIGIPSILFSGLSGWNQNFPSSFDKDDVVILPMIYDLFFRAYISYLKKDDTAGQLLDNCIKLCREKGYFLGAAYCIYLLKIMNRHVPAELSQEYMETLEYCGIGEKSHIIPLFSNSGNPLHLTLTSYKPPI